MKNYFFLREDICSHSNYNKIDINWQYNLGLLSYSLTMFVRGTSVTRLGLWNFADGWSGVTRDLRYIVIWLWWSWCVVGLTLMYDELWPHPWNETLRGILNNCICFQYVIGSASLTRRTWNCTKNWFDYRWRSW